MNNRFYIFALEKKNEILISLFFFIYFFTWNLINYNNIEINNNSILEAIRLYKFTPYLSFFLDNIFINLEFKNLLGYVIFPTLCALLIYIITKRLTSSNLWSYSITLLSMSSTENFPFIKFLISILKLENTLNFVNFYENFEIMGFPIPSLSILFFCLLFYYSLTIIRISYTKIYILTFFWFLGPFVHPVDGLLGLVYWICLIYFMSLLKKFKFNYIFIIYLFLLFIVSFILIFNQLNFEVLILKKDQAFPLYNLTFYFIVPLAIIIFLIRYAKIDFYEFLQKFLNIYILMFVELLVIFCSINGIGFDLRMFETRITMFLLHYLYYAPIIYYLNRDGFFILKKFDTNNNLTVFLLKFLYLLFNRYKNIYLIPFSLLLLAYFILSLGLYA